MSVMKQNAEILRNAKYQTGPKQESPPAISKANDH